MLDVKMDFGKIEWNMEIGLWTRIKCLVVTHMVINIWFHKSREFLEHWALNSF
jgi:hypothetical protein